MCRSDLGEKIRFSDQIDPAGEALRSCQASSESLAFHQTRRRWESPPRGNPLPGRAPARPALTTPCLPQESGPSSATSAGPPSRRRATCCGTSSCTRGRSPSSATSATMPAAGETPSRATCAHTPVGPGRRPGSGPEAARRVGCGVRARGPAPTGGLSPGAASAGHWPPVTAVASGPLPSCDFPGKPRRRGEGTSHPGSCSGGAFRRRPLASFGQVSGSS